MLQENRIATGGGGTQPSVRDVLHRQHVAIAGGDVVVEAWVAEALNDLRHC
jgi:hypothetical protein